MATRGTKASGGTDFVTGYTIDAAEANTDLNNAFSGINNITIADANVISAANIDPSKIGDYAGGGNDVEYQTTAAPASRDTANPGNYTTLTTSRPTDLEGEIARLRYLWKLANAGTIQNADGYPDAGEWYGTFGKGVMFATTGDVKASILDTPSDGWILLDDGTIGNAASGATNRDHTDTRELYRALWHMYGDTLCPVSTGRGADPDADFAANKTLRLPLWVGRSLGVAGTPDAANRIDAITGTQGLTGTMVRTGTSSTVFFLDPSTSSNTTSDYVGQEIRLLGTLVGNVQTISAYDATTHEITVDAGIGGTPAIGETYVIYPLNNSMFNLTWESGPTADDILNGYTIEITGGTGTLESKTIADYDASERKITITGTWTTNPDETTTFSIYKALPTRAAGDTIGTDLVIPTINTMAGHSHSIETGTQNNSGSFVARGLTGAVYNNSEAQGGGATSTQYQPTAFCYWHIKL